MLSQEIVSLSIVMCNLLKLIGNGTVLHLGNIFCFEFKFICKHNRFTFHLIKLGKPLQLLCIKSV